MEKILIINDCTKDELKTILNDWLVMYADGLKSKSIFEFAEVSPNIFILKIDKSIDDTLFFYLVNYFSAPIDFNRTFEVAGYTTASKHKRILNKNIYVFINEQDKEFDNVWLITEDNEIYKFDFGGKLKKMDIGSAFKYKELNINDLPISYEQIIVNKKELLEVAARKEKEEQNRKLDKRFKIIAPILFIGILGIILTNKYNPFFISSTWVVIVIILNTLWFFMDYKIFCDIKRTFICALLAVLFIIFGINTHDIFFATITTFPLSMMLVMLGANKLLGDKLDAFIWEHSKIGTMIIFAFSVLISAFVFHPILKHFFTFIS